MIKYLIKEIKRDLLKLFNRCEHCGSKELLDWNDSHLTMLSCGHVGKLCKKCNMITLRRS